MYDTICTPVQVLLPLSARLQENSTPSISQVAVIQDSYWSSYSTGTRRQEEPMNVLRDWHWVGNQRYPVAHFGRLDLICGLLHVWLICWRRQLQFVPRGLLTSYPVSLIISDGPPCLKERASHIATNIRNSAITDCQAVSMVIPYRSSITE